MSKIYITTSGVGKTYFCQHNPGWIDLDWFLISKTSDPEQFFISAIYFYSYWGYNILTNSHLSVQVLQKNNISVDGIIIPELNMKDEMRARISTRRGGQTQYTEQFMQNFEATYNYWSNIDAPKIFLQAGQYLSDIIDANGNIKPGIKVVN